jgi:ABC-type polysaccharide/polyol phosphate export permease
VEGRHLMSATPNSLAAELHAPARDLAANPDALEPVELLDYRPTLWQSLKEAYRSKHLLWDISMAALLAYITKYRLGAFWIVFQTFMAVIGYSLIFGGGIFNVHAPNGMPYFLYTMVGMMGWTLFQSTVVITARSFLRLKSLARDIYFPLIFVPIAGSAQAGLRFISLFVAYILTSLYFWIDRGHLYIQFGPKYLFFSVAGLFLCAALAWGIGMWTAPLTAHTRDVRMVVKFAIPFWLFITPVLYPIDHLHGKTRTLAELNPLSSPVEMAKVGLVGAGSVRTYAAIWSVCVIAAVLASGIWFMNRFGASVVGLYQDADDDDDEDLL